MINMMKNRWKLTGGMNYISLVKIENSTKREYHDTIHDKDMIGSTF